MKPSAKRMSFYKLKDNTLCSKDRAWQGPELSPFCCPSAEASVMGPEMQPRAGFGLHYPCDIVAVHSASLENQNLAG